MLQRPITKGKAQQELDVLLHLTRFGSCFRGENQVYGQRSTCAATLTLVFVAVGQRCNVLALVMADFFRVQQAAFPSRMSRRHNNRKIAKVADTVLFWEDFRWWPTSVYFRSRARVTQDFEKMRDGICIHGQSQVVRSIDVSSDALVQHGMHFWNMLCLAAWSPLVGLLRE